LDWNGVMLATKPKSINKLPVPMSVSKSMPSQNTASEPGSTGSKLKCDEEGTIKFVITSPVLEVACSKVLFVVSVGLVGLT
jgi:hypothetical protein